MGSTIALAEAAALEPSFLPAGWEIKVIGNADDVDAPAPAAQLIDSNEATGEVTAIVAVTNIVDHVGDLIQAGAYKNTLAKRRPKVCWAHSWEAPIGKVLRIEEWAPGDPRFAKVQATLDGKAWPAEAGALVAHMQLNLKSDKGREAFAAVEFYSKSGECEWSIGWQPIPKETSRRKDGVRVCKSVELFEVSPVLFGAAPLTRTLEVKALNLHAATRQNLATRVGVPAGAPGTPAAVPGAAPGDVPDGSGAPAGPVNEAAPTPGEADPQDPATLHRNAMDEIDWNEVDQAAADVAANNGQPTPPPAGDPEDAADGGADEATEEDPEDAADGGDDETAEGDTPPAGKRPTPAWMGKKKGDAVALSRKGLAQLIDGLEFAALTGVVLPDPTEIKAAGGPDQNRGGAENLRRWYTEPGQQGHAEIAWGSPGDFDRCVAIAGQHMDPERAKGYCQLRHHDALGIYTSTHAAMEHGHKGLLLPLARKGDALASAGVAGTTAVPVRDGLGLVVTLGAEHRTPLGAPDVLRVGDRFQVGAANAVALTAQVVDLKTFRNLPESQLIGQVVRGDHLAAQTGDAAVAVASGSAREQKAGAQVGSVHRNVSDYGLGGQAADGAGTHPTLLVRDRAGQVGVLAMADNAMPVAGAQPVQASGKSAALDAAQANGRGLVHGLASKRIPMALPATVVAVAQTAGHDGPSLAAVDDAPVTLLAHEVKGIATPRLFVAATPARSKALAAAETLAKSWNPLLEVGAYAGHGRSERKFLADGIDGLAGSFEQRQSKLREALDPVLKRAVGLTPPTGPTSIEAGDGMMASLPNPWNDAWTSIDGTWPDRVVATIMYRDDADGGTRERQAFVVPYTFAGEDVTLGDPQPVDLKVTIVPTDGVDTDDDEDAADGGADEATEGENDDEDGLTDDALSAAMLMPTLRLLSVGSDAIKSVLTRSPEVKAGRVLSEANSSRLRGALEHLLEVARSAGIDLPGWTGPDTETPRDDQRPDTTAPQGMGATAPASARPMSSGAARLRTGGGATAVKTLDPAALQAQLAELGL